MLFNSIDFALFLPVVFCIYWVFRKNVKHQNLFLLAASYFFYAWWDWRYLSLILVCSITNFAAGALMVNRDDRREEKRREEKRREEKRSKLILSLCCIICFGILGVFKYYDFFVHTFVDAFSLFGAKLEAHTLNLILPVGISFYTFHTLSYTIDVYRGKFAPTRDITSFFLFVSIFPLAMAGPIERATNLLPQIYKKREFNYSQAVDGMRQILWGLFKKVVIADNCATYVNQVFDSYQTQSGSTLLLGAIFFAFQIYGDFSGYSDMAIGVGKLLGFKFLNNFRFPYCSRDIAEFWRRWHISLNTWFRDYLYIPLGGSRGSKTMVVRNTFIIFLVSGFWHGANWTFIAWGAFHAVLFLPLILLNRNRKYTDTVAEGKFLPSVKELFQMFLTFGLVVVGWVFFRAESIGEAVGYLAGIVKVNLFSVPLLINRDFYIPLFVNLLILFVVEWLQRNRQHGLEIMPSNLVLRWLIYVLICAVIYKFGEFNYSQFIYFQF